MACGGCKRKRIKSERKRQRKKKDKLLKELEIKRISAMIFKMPLKRDK